MRIDSKKRNYIFIGGAGSGKSEIALNVALLLHKMFDTEIHFFDTDMTKPLFRSRDLADDPMFQGIVFHFEKQFMDAPTQVGGVRELLQDPDAYVVMDVGGDDVGARLIGGYMMGITPATKQMTEFNYVVNSYRPWSNNVGKMDETMSQILYVSHIKYEDIKLIANPNIGYATDVSDVVKGIRDLKETLLTYKKIDGIFCERRLADDVSKELGEEVYPIDLYLKQDWLESENFAV